MTDVDGGWEVRLSPPAARTLYQLPPRLADAVIRFCHEPLASNPYRVTKALGAELAGQRAGYVGIGFRVLVRIDDDQRLVTVMRMAYRADAYR
ncbi:type II toxin-antitoxin system RelE/ParE family toxin [Cellulosimicrobium funkei]|uniref:type II toxin-antitoxin system RelE family toxin n=1 Tax=Cellulosimicrobium funkei TaxID=264251 RepID=UPI003649EE8F